MFRISSVFILFRKIGAKNNAAISTGPTIVIIINDFFLEVKDKNLVIILRKDSLYLKDYLIIEDVLDLENLKDFEKYNKYWKNEIFPLEEENKELEEFFLEEKELNNHYIKINSEEFLMRYYF